MKYEQNYKYISISKLINKCWGKKVVEIFTFNDAPQKIRVTSFYRIEKY